MKRSDAFPSKYVSKEDVETPRLVTIGDVSHQSIQSDGANVTKPVAHFLDYDKPLILNGANWMFLESQFGDDSDNWRGKKVELYAEPSVMYGNKRVGGVRARMPGTKAAPPRTTGIYGYWSMYEAVQKCSEVGITKPELIERLKMLGLKGYNPQRDTGAVQMIIEEAKANKPDESGFDDIPSATDEVSAEDMPF